MIRPAELTNLLTMIRASTAAMAEAIALLLHNPTEDKPMPKLSRHTLVAGAATLPALAGSVAAITPDPAVAAVELVQAAYKAIEDVMDEVPEDRRDTAWDTKNETVLSAHSQAEWDMVQTVPTTRAGAVAMITAYIEQNEPDGADRELLESLAEAIPHLV
jgi:hypothetical protein